MKKRILGAILIILVSIPIIIMGGNVFRVACGILGVFALKEVIDLKIHHKKIPYGIMILSVLSLLILIYSTWNEYNNFFSINDKAICFLLLSMFIPCIFYQEKNYSAHESIYLSGSILLISIFFNRLIFIREFDINILLYLIFISIFTDTFALFIGKLIGKHKCTPIISPNKTWEGCIGGTIMGVTISSIFYIFCIKNCNVFLVILLTLFLSIIGQFGDLIFSKIKRENGIKDFSNIIVGHGGILDRFDSLLFIVLGYILFF